MGRTSPVVAQFEFAARVRKRREELGLPAATVSKHLGFTRNFYSAVENSRSLLATAKLPLLIEVLEFDDTDAQTLATLLEQARTPGWWQPYTAVLDDDLVQFFGLEYGASSIFSYESLVFNGLLQCEEYALNVVNSSLNTSAVLKRRSLEIRLKRQEMLLRTRGRPMMTFIVGEAVLWQQFGTPEVLLHQLQHVLELMESMRDNVDLRIRTFDTTPLGLANASTMVLLDFESPVLGTMAYREAGFPIGVSSDPNLVDGLKMHFEHALASSCDRSRSIEILNERISGLVN